MWLLLLLGAGTPGFVFAQGGDPNASRGEGLAQIVGGNMVSARRRALQLAQQDALRNGARAWLAQRLPAAARGDAETRILAQAARLTRSYRVLTEEQQGENFKVVVEVRLVPRLLERAVGPLAAAPIPPAPGQTNATLSAVLERVERMKVEGQPLDLDAGALARGQVAAALEQRGIPILSPAAAKVWGRRGRALRLSLRWSLVAARGVRGLGLRGAAATVEVRGELGGRHERIVDRAWGSDMRLAVAGRKALSAGLRQALTALVARFHTTVPSRSASPPLLTIEGIRDAGLIHPICAVVLQYARVCQPLLIERERLELRVGSGPVSAGLVRGLTEYRFAGFALVLDRLSSDGVRLRLRAADKGPGTTL